MFLTEQDLYCTITLAGASEEILGRYATKSEEKNMVNLICSSLKNAHSINLPDKTFKWEYLNKARNTLKHFDGNIDESIEMVPENEAISMIIRAIGNLYFFDKTVTHNTPAFLQWIADNRSDLFED